MSGLFGGGKTVAVNQPKLAGLQIMTAAYGGAVPIIYGTMRVPGTLIDYDDFVAIAHQTKQSAGKGGNIVTTDYTYTTMVLLALCEGPIDDVNVIWADKDRGTLALFGFTLEDGSIGQAAWGYLTTHHPAKAIGYSGTAYVAASALNLGAQGTMKNFSFEVGGFLIGGDAGIAGQDSEPAEFIPDYLTNAYYGAGWDPAKIGDLEIGQSGTVASSYRRYTQASGFFLSPAIIEQKAAAGHLADWLVATNSAAIFTEGVLKLIPYGDQVVTGNGKTFTPYVTPIYDLTADDFIVSGPDDPRIVCERADLSDSFNTIPVEFRPRTTDAATSDYNTSLEQDPESVDADQYGVRQGATLGLPAITSRSVALQISRIQAQRSVYIRNTYTFKLPWRYILLDPMDLVTLTDDVFGLATVVVRIKEIREDKDGMLTFTAEEWPFGSATGALYSTQENDGLNPNTAVDPGDVTVPLIFDVPMLAAKKKGDVEVAIATAGGNDWGGCEVWMSFDNVTYQLQGAIVKKAAYGVLTGTYAAGTGFDTTHTLPVDLAISGQPLETVSDQEAEDLQNLSYCDGELLSFATATLTGADAYNLTRIERGALGTPSGAHLGGTDFARFDDAVFRAVVPPSRVGSVVYFKLPSFNIYGGGLQELASVSAYSHTPSTVGLEPPYPASVSLSISTSQPIPSGPATQRAKLAENSSALKVDGGTGTTEGKPTRYVTIDWSPVSIYPATLLTGYEIVLFTGVDPNDLAKWLTSNVIVGPDANQLIIALEGDTAGNVTMNGAVRALYGTDPSSWRTASGTVVLSPGTIPLNIPLSVELIQTASDKTTATFTVTVRDPLGKITSGTVFVAWAGLTGVLDNQTGLPVAASFTATYGTAYSFTATLNAAFRGAGYVKFRATATGRGDGFSNFYAAELDQNATPDLVIDIGNNQSSSDVTALASAVVNAPSNSSTIKWLASTSAFPSQASVIASGAVVSGGSPFVIADLGVTLALGDTVYLSAVYYDSFGTAQTFAQGSAVRETLSAQKTVTFSAGGLFTPYGVAATDFLLDPTDGSFQNVAGNGAYLTGTIPLAEGCTIVSVSASIWQATYYNSHPIFSGVQAIFYEDTDATTFASPATVSSAAAWVTVTASCSQATTSKRIVCQVLLLDGFGSASATERIRSVSVTYIPDNTQATV